MKRKLVARERESLCVKKKRPNEEEINKYINIHIRKMCYMRYSLIWRKSVCDRPCVTNRFEWNTTFELRFVDSSHCGKWTYSLLSCSLHLKCFPSIFLIFCRYIDHLFNYCTCYWERIQKQQSKANYNIQHLRARTINTYSKRIGMLLFIIEYFFFSLCRCKMLWETQMQNNSNVLSIWVVLIACICVS